MNRITPFHALSLLGLAAILGGCAADPAADAPAAQVSSPAAETAAETPADASTTVYALADDSTIGFIGSKVTGSHEGGFHGFDGEITVADGSVEGSSIAVNIDVDSMWTDSERLTGHLKSADFFDAENHPTASFTSTGIAANGDGSYTVSGNLDLHGVTKQISFPATIALTDDGFTANAEFSIKRFDFGIEYAGKADDLIRDDVLIKLDLRSATADAAAGDDMGGEGDMAGEGGMDGEDDMAGDDEAHADDAGESGH